MRSLPGWLETPALTDPLQRRQARMLHLLILLNLGGILVGFFLALATPGTVELRVLSGAASLVTAALYLAALWSLRRGGFPRAAMLTCLGLLLLIVGYAVPTGVSRNGVMAMPFMLPGVLAGLMLGRRGMLLVGGLTAASLVVIGGLEQLPVPLAGFAGQPVIPLPIFTIAIVLIVGLLVVFMESFGVVLRETLHESLGRERELERLRDDLERTVAERTASLAEALRSVEQREARLAEMVRELQASQAAVRELSAPVIPVLPGVLVAPLVGALDAERTASLAENTLAAIESQRARHIVLDVTGVPVVDTQVAQALLRVAAAARLLGATPALAGIRPEVAQTIVALGVGLGELRTYADLQEAVVAISGRR